MKQKIIVCLVSFAIVCSLAACSDEHTEFNEKAEKKSGPTASVSKNLSAEQIDEIQRYWTYDENWAMTMPCHNEYGDTWSVGLSSAHEIGLGIPYDFTGERVAKVRGSAAISYFSNVEYRYYDGLTFVVLSGFYGDNPDEPGYAVTQYISATQPDCKTPRGISPGNTLDELKAAYPEVKEQPGDQVKHILLTGAKAYDQCFLYAPENISRSILFLIQKDVIVQIDMADSSFTRNPL